MPTFHLHLKNVPPEASTLDIRHFFSPLDIPDGGVQIVGGTEGNVFVTFLNYEQLLQAAMYNKKCFMGRQLAAKLVDGNDIKKVIEEMMHSLGAQDGTMEISSSQPMSESRELPSAWGDSEVPKFTHGSPWSNRRRAATPPQLAEDGTMYDAGGAKRMRLSGHETYEDSYSSSWTASSRERDTTSRKDKLAMELELELKTAQEIADELEKKKERIQKLKHGILIEDIDPVDTAMEMDIIPQSTNSRADWQRRQPEQQSRYQYSSEERMSPEPYQDFPRRTMEEPRYNRDESEIYQDPRPAEDWRYGERFARHESSFVQPSARHRRQTDDYILDDTVSIGSGPYYEDQKSTMDHNRWDTNTSTDQPQKIRDPFRRDRSPEMYRDHRSADVLHGDVFRHSRAGGPEVNKQSKIPDLRWLKTTSIAPVRPIPKTAPMTAPSVSSAAKPAVYYLQLVSLPPDTTACTVWSWFGGAAGPCSHVTLTGRFDRQGNEKTAYAAFRNGNIRDAEMKKYGGTKSMREKEALSCIARDGMSPDVVICKSTTKGADIIMTQAQKLALMKEWYPQGLPKKSASTQVKSLSSKQVKPLLATPQVQPLQSSAQVKKQKPTVDDSKALLYFLTLRSLPANTTASSVWKSMGGSRGPSVGVLMFDQKGSEAEKMAFVAFEGYRDRNAQLLKNSKASSWSDTAVYVKCSKGPPGSKVFKTTPTGDAIVNENTLFKPEFVKEVSKIHDKSKKEKDEQRSIVNRFSRSLFYGSTDEKPPTNIQDSKGKTVGKDQTKVKTEKKKRDPENVKECPYVLKIPDISQDKSACKVWSWFGGGKGPAQDVTFVGDGETRIAFVRFSDPVKCKQEQVKYKLSKIITESEMLRMLACCDPKNRIKRSSPNGDSDMSVKDRAALKKRFEKEAVKGSDGTKVMAADPPSGTPNKVPDKVEEVNPEERKEDTSTCVKDVEDHTPEEQGAGSLPLGDAGTVETDKPETDNKEADTTCVQDVEQSDDMSEGQCARTCPRPTVNKDGQADTSSVLDLEQSDPMANGQSVGTSPQPELDTDKTETDKKLESSPGEEEGNNTSSTWELELMEDTSLGDPQLI